LGCNDRRCVHSYPVLHVFLLFHSGVYARQPTNVPQAGSRFSYSFCRRPMPSQNGSGSLPLKRATSTSRCMCQPGPTFMVVPRSGKRRWITVNRTLVPFGSNSNETSPAFPNANANLRGGSTSMIRLCILCSPEPENPAGRLPGGLVSSSLRQTNSKGAP